MNFLQKDNTEIPFDSPIADYISKIEKRKKNAKQITINKPKKQELYAFQTKKEELEKQQQLLIWRLFLQNMVLEFLLLI